MRKHIQPGTCIHSNNKTIRTIRHVAEATERALFGEKQQRKLSPAKNICPKGSMDKAYRERLECL